MYIYILISFIISIFSNQFEDINAAISSGTNSEGLSERLGETFKHNRDNPMKTETFDRKKKNYDVKVAISGKEYPISQETITYLNKRNDFQDLKKKPELDSKFESFKNYKEFKELKVIPSRTLLEMTSLHKDKDDEIKRFIGESKAQEVELETASNNKDGCTDNNGSNNSFLTGKNFKNFMADKKDIQRTNNKKQNILFGDAQANHNQKSSKKSSQTKNKELDKPSQKPIQRPCNVDDGRQNGGNGQDVRQECENYEENQEIKCNDA